MRQQRQNRGGKGKGRAGRGEGGEREEGREGGELSDERSPEIQASKNGAQRACITCSQWRINTGLVNGPYFKVRMVCVIHL